MIILKIGIVMFFVVLFIILGGMSTAWRRACVHITTQIKTTEFMDDLLKYNKMPRVTRADVARYTPKWVSSRASLSLFFLLFSSVIAAVLHGVYVGIAVAVGTYIATEVVAFIFPERRSQYYVAQIYSSYCQTLKIAEKFGDEMLTADMKSRIADIKNTYLIIEEIS